MAGTPEGGSNDLKRRILGSNYGLGLQTDRALESLRVLRTPAAVPDKQLSTARGFIVKSGEPTLIQVASPYEGIMPGGAVTSVEDEMARQAQALDWWVETIQVKYGTALLNGSRRRPQLGAVAPQRRWRRTRPCNGCSCCSAAACAVR